MALIIRVLLFIAANLAGYLMILVIPVLALKTGMLAHLPQDMRWYLVGSFLVYMGCLLASIGSFFADGKRRLLFLLAPISITPLYGIGVLVYFTLIVKAV